MCQRTQVKIKVGIETIFAYIFTPMRERSAYFKETFSYLVNPSLIFAAFLGVM